LIHRKRLALFLSGTKLTPIGIRVCDEFDRPGVAAGLQSECLCGEGDCFVIIRFGGAVGSGGAGDMTNVTQVFQPYGVDAASFYRWVESDPGNFRQKSCHPAVPRPRRAEISASDPAFLSVDPYQVLFLSAANDPLFI
jgi:hypothetical protein